MRYIVGQAHERLEVRLRNAGPDAVTDVVELDERLVRVNPGPVVVDVAVVLGSEDDLNIFGVRRPDCEPDALLTALAELLGSKEPAKREVVACCGLPSGLRQDRVAFGPDHTQVRVLSGNPPLVPSRRSVHADAPPDLVASQSVVEIHRHFEGRAAVLGDDLPHRYIAPAVPCARQPGVTEQRPLNASDVHEPDSNHLGSPRSSLILLRSANRHKAAPPPTGMSMHVWDRSPFRFFGEGAPCVPHTSRTGMSQTPDPRANGISTNDYCALLPKQRLTHEAQGLILLQPRTGGQNLWIGC